MRNFKTLFGSVTALVFSATFITSCSESEDIQLEDEASEELTIDPYSDRYGEEIIGLPFEMELVINTENPDRIVMDVDLNILFESFILSYNSGDEFMGRFLITLEDNEFVSLSGAPIESPEPVEEIYHWADNEKVQKLKGKVDVEQEIILLSKDDFEVTGFVSFTVEPNCNFYETHFIISNKAGVLAVEKLDTRKNPQAAPDYKP